VPLHRSGEGHAGGGENGGLAEAVTVEERVAVGGLGERIRNPDAPDRLWKAFAVDLGDRAAEAAEHVVVLDGDRRAGPAAERGDRLRVERFDSRHVHHLNRDAVLRFEHARGLERATRERTREEDRQVLAGLYQVGFADTERVGIVVYRFY